MKPLYIKTLLRFLPIVFDLERANQLSLLPDKDLVDLCHPIKPYQVTKNHKILSIPVHRNQDLKIGTLKSIMKIARLSEDDL
ncbi:MULTISPECIES: type II toxin-antitoxin system HicA family toxin [Microcystis]|uniref:Type II toxin-antitoxin system HicA family toxin n=2 Tax=Microcystis TaxID=1125 RepID=B0JG85_MICAN|nr:type II toxin-antitoxin system HicA family toxin [Microcystis viridis]BAG02090.1 hypothetical protein MAE_22680 [Microcystis aeruginosa NIES-843]BBH42858.1 hypothetical protein myaer102_55340 [Microcystis viridis NIES-102]